jgi:hypothetical protein
VRVLCVGLTLQDYGWEVNLSNGKLVKYVE